MTFMMGNTYERIRAINVQKAQDLIKEAQLVSPGDLVKNADDTICGYPVEHYNGGWRVMDDIGCLEEIDNPRVVTKSGYWTTLAIIHYKRCGQDTLFPQKLLDDLKATILAYGHPNALKNVRYTA